MEDIWLTIEEISVYLKVSKETIYKMVQQNQLPASKLGNQWRFNRETVDAWLFAQSNIKMEQKKVINE